MLFCERFDPRSLWDSDFQGRPTRCKDDDKTMVLVSRWLVAVLALTVVGCGRIRFDPLDDAANGDAAADGIDADQLDAGPLGDAALCSVTPPPACGGCESPVTCSFAGSCCTCSNGTWFCTTQSTDPRCPTTVPGGGATCPLADEGLQCAYCPNGEVRSCSGGNWSLDIGTCAG
jgi:hypothetical protein